MRRDDVGKLFLFGHFAVRGAMLGPGKIAEEGVDPALVDAFRGSLLGHFHIHRKPYLGPLVPIDRKMPNQPGYMAIVDDETAKITYIKNDAPRFITDPEIEPGQRDYVEEKEADVEVPEIKTASLDFDEVAGQLIEAAPESLDKKKLQAAWREVVA